MNDHTVNRVEDDDIGQLKNLGPASTKWLRTAGILTQSQLRDIGPVVAYKIVCERIPNASLNLLWALAAGLDGKDWRELSVARKSALRSELQRLTQADEL